MPNHKSLVSQTTINNDVHIRFSDAYDTLEYPLLFTDNDKANPKFFARTVFPGAKRLIFSNFREICSLTKTKDQEWKKNNLGPEYSPCPSSLMEEYACPVNGCNEEKCAIHWSLCY